ncbi:MAG: trimethylamine methyltransferase, partial [Desulfobacterales bacterium]|nr:trimethylamine methyltransferase [Desulfobacterales bacterium]
MNSNFKSQCIPEYRILNNAQIKRIHCATLELLETVGVKIMDIEAREMLAHAGCRIKEENIVQIPNWLVEECIQSAPSRITIYNRMGEEAMRLEGKRTHYGLGTDLINTYDLDTGELRQSQLQDVANAARIADALEDIDFIGSYALPFDSTSNMGYIDSFKAELENSIKPIFYTAAGPEDMAVINSMAAAAVGGADILREKPIHIHYSEPLTPLMHSAGAVKKLFYCADNLVPVTYTPGMMSGATAPITLAGAITVGNAEALSGVVMHQLKNKGAPIISGFGMSTMDMKTSACIYGCPEYRLALSACSDMYHYYGIPMWGTAGVSDANCLDEQAGMEWGVSLLTAALDGANLIHDLGYLGQGLIGHPAAIVI